MNHPFEKLATGNTQSVTRREALKKFALDLTVVALACFPLENKVQAAADTVPAKSTAPIPWSQIGSKAGAEYRGDGLGVVPTGAGAQLRCVFQRLEGDVMREGLWLTSTVDNAPKERFRVTAAGLGRGHPCALGAPNQTSNTQPSTFNAQLDSIGNVAIAGQTVCFLRPGVIEEYTVSMDGIRQDFIIPLRPAGAGQLCVTLAVDGARAETAADGAQLVLQNSRRKIAYSRLRVTDATGKQLTARMEVASGILPDGEGGRPGARSLAAKFFTASLPDSPESAGRESPDPRQAGMGNAAALVVLVNDGEAVYPVRIDPTFSDANWISMGSIPGVDGAVWAAVTDGSGNVYIGGEFTLVGDLTANRIAKWNGSSWSALDSGIEGGGLPTVRALAVSGSDVYAAGYFYTAGGSPANNVAKWNGSSWSPLGSGVGGDDGGFQSVSALAVSGSELYAGGWFTTAGGSPANNIAKWDGNSWSALGSGIDGRVHALAASGSDVYAGGEFSTAGGSEAHRIAKWNGSDWSALGSGMVGYAFSDSTVYALAVSGSDLYAGGWFEIADGRVANNIAKWNGNSWSALGSGMDSAVRALMVSGDNLYAGGQFGMAGGSAANAIARWDGTNWSALSSGMAGDSVYVVALAVRGGELFAGGVFRTAGSSAANGIAKWNGSAWSGIGSGMDGIVHALAMAGSDLYVGGSFRTAGSIAANSIAKWDGSKWFALGSGLSGNVYALAVSGTNVYAGGTFRTTGGAPGNYIARWNGSSWSALGAGMDNEVYALAVSGNNVYAGGLFETAGGIRANYIAKWNGSNWSTLGAGLNHAALALALSGDDLYAGGWFATAGGRLVNGIAKWNGSSWSSLGSGLMERADNGSVYALAVSGGNLYAGGGFTTAGGVAANNIAKWDGNTWSALGSGTGEATRSSIPYVYALAVSGNDVYAGGDFTSVDGVPANFIAKWSGSSWSALGSGLDGHVRALVLPGNDLYVGGGFWRAGGKISTWLARAYLPTLPALSMLRSGTNVVVSWPSVDTAAFALEQAGTLATPIAWVTNTANVTDDGMNKSVTIPVKKSPQLFRLRQQ